MIPGASLLPSPQAMVDMGMKALAPFVERHGGVLLIGCGRMGGALLRSWLGQGLPPEAVQVMEPQPADWVGPSGVKLVNAPAGQPGTIVVAVKPAHINDALQGQIRAYAQQALIISIAAGVRLARLESILPPGAAVIRAMPNTPAAIGQGITAMIGNDRVMWAQMEAAQTLLSAAGAVVVLDEEEHLDAVTGISGSGPAYVYYMIECLAQAGEDAGLPANIALQMARATVAGASALAKRSGESPRALRAQVTTRGGTTEAALAELANGEKGLAALMSRTVAAAVNRSRELGSG